LLQVIIATKLADPAACQRCEPISDVMVNDEGILKVKKDLNGQQKDEYGKINDISLSSVLFEGRLRVTDRDLFLETMKKGIGSGKAYGFELLSIAKAL